MTGEEFVPVWQNKGLRKYIVNQAKRRSQNKEVQEDLIQEAWLCIGCAPHDYDTESYKQLAHKAIYSAYWQENKERLLSNSVKVMATKQTVTVWNDRKGTWVQVVKDLY